jgi:hypothetical protein
MSASSSPSFDDLTKLSNKMADILKGMTALVGRIEALEATNVEIHKILQSVADNQGKFVASSKALTEAQIKTVGILAGQVAKLGQDVADVYSRLPSRTH